MARAETASASLRSDSIQGLAKSIAKPAYRRLVSAEPLLRRAVPVLIIAFLLTICVGAVVQVLEQRRQVVRDARQAIEALADQITFGLEYTGRDLRGNPNRNSAALSSASTPAWAATADRVVLLADADGAIIASYPNDPQKLGRPILDLLGPTQPLTTFGAAAGTLGDHAARRRYRLALGARPAQSARRSRGRADGKRRARQLARQHGADHNAFGHDRLRRADPRLCVSLAGDTRPRSRSHP